MSDPVLARPAICLNMIVRNEAHIIREALDSVAPYISSWVIVDTGSNDGTQDLIRNHMAGLGIPGELYERPWHNFGHNRTEALNLAQGRGDYIWVMDADDIVVGTPDFTGLSADLYYLRLRQSGSFVYWRGVLFRDGLPWFYRGVVHEYPWCDDPHGAANLEGDYHIESRRVGARNLEPKKYARDRDLLLAEVAGNPEDARSVFYLAQSYRDLGDFRNARRWYARRAEMAGFDQEAYVAMHQVVRAIDAASSYPDAVAGGGLITDPRDAEITVNLVAGPDRAGVEQALNSFLNCCAISVTGRAVPGGRYRSVGCGARDAG
ncbi:MAG: glycosyltransferase [Mycobacterium sp.]